MEFKFKIQKVKIIIGYIQHFNANMHSIPVAYFVYQTKLIYNYKFVFLANKVDPLIQKINLSLDFVV